MHLTTRESNILLSLLDQASSIDHLSCELKVSRKTILSDIKNINLKLQSFDSEILNDSGNLSFISIYTSVHWRNMVRMNMTIEESDLIVLKLAFKDDYISIGEFADELYMSKSKLEKMIATSKILNEYLTKKRNLGIKLELSEKQKLNLTISLLLPYVDDLNYLVISRLLVQQISECKITISEFKQDIEYFNQTVSQIAQVTDNECKILILLILISRHLLKLDYDDIEVYILDYINNENKEEKISLIVEKELRDVLHQNNIEQIPDHILTALSSHIDNAIRNPFSSNIDESMQMRLKTEYSYAYNIAHEIVNRLCKVLKVEINQVEVYYITMYIQSIINNTSPSQDLKVLIVCQYGLSVSNYIQVWLEQNLNIPCNYQISSVLNYWQLGVEVSNFDVVITTVDNLEIENTKVISLNTIPLEKELIELKNKLIRISFQKQIESFFSCQTLKLVDINNVNELYPYIESDLAHSSRAFIKAMIKRTDKGLSNINGVIIMHSDGSLLTENRLLIYKLKTPIVYNGEEVKMIFVFAFTSEFIEMFNHVIKQIYRVIYSSNYVSALYETSTDKQFMWIFRNQIRGGNYVNK